MTTDLVRACWSLHYVINSRCGNSDYQFVNVGVGMVLHDAWSYGHAPGYLVDMVVPVSHLPGRSHLRSAQRGVFDTPRHSRTVLGSTARSLLLVFRSIHHTSIHQPRHVERINKKAVLSQRWPAMRPIWVPWKLSGLPLLFSLFPTPPLVSPKFVHVSLEISGSHFGCKERRCWANRLCNYYLSHCYSFCSHFSLPLPLFPTAFLLILSTCLGWCMLVWCMGQVIKSLASVCLSVLLSVCLSVTSLGRKSHSILMKLYTMDRNPKSKNPFVGGQNPTTPSPIFHPVMHFQWEGLNTNGTSAYPVFRIGNGEIVIS